MGIVTVKYLGSELVSNRFAHTFEYVDAFHLLPLSGDVVISHFVGKLCTTNITVTPGLLIYMPHFVCSCFRLSLPFFLLLP